MSFVLSCQGAKKVPQPKGSSNLMFSCCRTIQFHANSLIISVVMPLQDAIKVTEAGAEHVVPAEAGLDLFSSLWQSFCRD